MDRCAYDDCTFMSACKDFIPPDSLSGGFYVYEMKLHAPKHFLTTFNGIKLSTSFFEM